MPTTLPVFDLERFFSKVNKTPTCWLWTGCTRGRAVLYGAMLFNGRRKDRITISAHRISWMIYEGDIPDGMHVLHKCDNGLCVNPDHLYLGTNADNMHDRELKGRGVRQYGICNNKTKLSTEEVEAIRKEYRYGNAKELAAKYGVAPSNISYIVQNKTRTKG